MQTFACRQIFFHLMRNFSDLNSLSELIFYDCSINSLFKKNVFKRISGSLDNFPNQNIIIYTCASVVERWCTGSNYISFVLYCHYVLWHFAEAYIFRVLYYSVPKYALGVYLYVICFFPTRYQWWLRYVNTWSTQLHQKYVHMEKLWHAGI